MKSFVSICFSSNQFKYREFTLTKLKAHEPSIYYYLRWNLNPLPPKFGPCNNILICLFPFSPNPNEKCCYVKRLDGSVWWLE